MRVYLIRHAQTTWNNEGRAQGHTDVEIDRVGRAQARLAAEFFDRRIVHRVLSSDLKRCLQTAQPTADLTELAVDTRRELRERSFGVLEGQHYTVLRAYFDGENRARQIPRHEVRPEGGESVVDVWRRVKPVVQEIERLKEDTVIFSHGGTIALLLAQMLKANVETALGFKFDNASVTEVKRLPTGIWQMVRYNDSRHLDVLHEEPAAD